MELNKKNLVGLIVVVIIALFGFNTLNPDLSPEAVRLNQNDVPIAGNQTSVTDDTFYEILDATEFSGEKWSVKYFTILAKPHSTKTPADYDDTVCGLYFDEVFVGNVSQFNNQWVYIESEKTYTSNLTFKCGGLGNSGSDTVYYDVVYRWQ